MISTKMRQWLGKIGLSSLCLAMVAVFLVKSDLQAVALCAVGLTQHPSPVAVTASRPVASAGTDDGFGSEDSQDPPPTTVTTAATAASGAVAGKVVETVLPVGTVTPEGVAIRNRSGVDLDVAAFLKTLPDIRIQKTDEPQVLLYHTHTTESYMPYFDGTYRKGEAARTQNEAKNVCAIGEVIAAELRAVGIEVIHDTTVHDDPQYTGAYSRSEKTAQAILKQYPSIKVALDIHRDGVMMNDTDKAKPTVTVNGRKAAQLMIICGTVSTAANPSPHWKTNFSLALHLQRDLTADYGKLMRQMSVVASRYNQHLADACLLVEVGSEGNTMEEAVYTAELFGKSLAGILAAVRK